MPPGPLPSGPDPAPSPAAAAAAAKASSAVWYLAGATAGLSCALLPFLVVPWLPKKVFGALPYMHTPRAKIEALFQRTLPRHVPPVRQRGRRRRFIDLGSGLGEAVIEARRHGYEARGVELNPTLYLLSVVNALRHAGPAAFVRDPRMALRLGNMWSVDLRDYDIIMIFGVQSLMPRLTAKIRAEARDRAVVVLYRFHLDLKEREKEKGEEVGTNNTEARIELLEAEDELSVYRVERPARRGGGQSNMT